MPITTVVGAPGVAASRSVGRKAAVRAKGGRFTLDGEDEAAAEAPPGPVAFVSPPALLQLQEALEQAPAGSRAAALRHGADLLDRLDDLRLALLAGAVAPGRLRALADAVAARRGPSDPRLDAIIAEIELRCAVELAKFRHASAPGPLQPGAPEPLSRSKSEG